MPKAVVTGLNVGISTATHVVQKATGLAEKTGEQLVQWIPGITEQERNQAELLDSDSDAAYDEDNVRDNQIDGDMVLDDDSDDEGVPHGDNADEPASEKNTLTILQETFGAPQPVVTARADEAAFDNVFGTGLSNEDRERLAAEEADALNSAPMASTTSLHESGSGSNAVISIPPLSPAPARPTRSIGAPPPPLPAELLHTPEHEEEAEVEAVEGSNEITERGEEEQEK